MHAHMKRHRTRQSSLRRWKNYYGRSLPLFEKYVAKDHIIYIKYEDLANNTSRELEKICNMLDIHFESTMLDFATKLSYLSFGT